MITMSPPYGHLNRNKPVGENTTLQLLRDGNLVLRDADGSLVWSTNTSNKSVVGMKIMETGNNKTIWQSFDHPTDTLLPGQKLVPGQILVASVSETNNSEGNLALSIASEGSVDSVFVQAVLIKFESDFMILI